MKLFSQLLRNIKTKILWIVSWDITIISFIISFTPDDINSPLAKW